jgi:hypothetical protein
VILRQCRTKKHITPVHNSPAKIGLKKKERGSMTNRRPS